MTMAAPGAKQTLALTGKRRGRAHRTVGGGANASRLLGFARLVRRDDQCVVLETESKQAGIVAVEQRAAPEDFTRGAVQYNSTQALRADVDSEDGLACRWHGFSVLSR